MSAAGDHQGFLVTLRSGEALGLVCARDAASAKTLAVLYAAPGLVSQLRQQGRPLSLEHALDAVPVPREDLPPWASALIDLQNAERRRGLSARHAARARRARRVVKRFAGGNLYVRRVVAIDRDLRHGRRRDAQLDARIAAALDAKDRLRRAISVAA